MRADITVKITDTAREGNIPVSIFSRQSPLSLDLPADTDDFISALEALIAQNFTPIATRLAAKVREDVDVYLTRMRALGVEQLQLPLPNDQAAE